MFDLKAIKCIELQGINLTEQIKIKFIIIKFALYLFAIIPNILLGQCYSTVELTPCEEMMKKKDNHFFQFSLIYKGDTLIVPKVGKNLYLNPVKLYGLDSLDFVKRKNDTIQSINILIETTKFIYATEVYASFFTYSSNFCLKKGFKTKWKSKKWEYAFYEGNAYVTLHKAKRIKKK